MKEGPYMRVDELFDLAAFTSHAGFKSGFTAAALSTTVAVENFCVRLGVEPLCAVAAEVPQLFVVLMVFQALDMISGVFAARERGERIRSHRLGVGITRKITMQMVCLAAGLLDLTAADLGVTTGENSYAFVAVCAWFIGQELLSLYENAEDSQIPMPPLVKRFAHWLLEKGGDNSEGRDYHEPPLLLEDGDDDDDEGRPEGES